MTSNCCFSTKFCTIPQTALELMTLYEPRSDGDAITFYETFLEPANWWEWFHHDASSDNEGWTQVKLIITK